MAKTFKFENANVSLGTSIAGAVGGISAGAASVGAGTVVFSNSNGVTFGLNGSTVTASVAAGGGGGAGISAGTQSVSTGTVVFSNSNGVSFGMSGSSRVTASHNGLTAGIQSLSAGTTRATAGEVVFSNSNGLAFGLNGATITGSYTVPTQSNQQISAYAAGNSTQSSSGTFNASSIVFRGDGVASVGVSNGSVVVSVPAGGGGLTNINVSGGTTSNNLSNLVFADGGNVSFGLNGSTITASAPAGGGGATFQYWNPQDAYLQVAGQQGAGTMHIQPARAPNVTFDRIAMPLYFSGASNSTMTASLSVGFMIYTRNVSTLSSLSSVSTSVSVNHSGTASSSVNNGIRLLTIPFAGSLPEEQYYIGIWSRTSSAGVNAATISQILASQLSSNYSGIWGVGSTASGQYTRGLGIFSVSFSTALPATVAMSDIRGTGALALRQPIFYLVNGTI